MTLLDKKKIETKENNTFHWTTYFKEHGNSFGSKLCLLHSNELSSPFITYIPFSSMKSGCCDTVPFKYSVPLVVYHRRKHIYCYFLSSHFQADSWCYHVNSWIKDRVVLITSWVPFRFNESILPVLKIKHSERAFPSQTEHALLLQVVKSKHSLHRWRLLAATHPRSLKKCIFKFYSVIQCYLLI